jgi:hypothetical protein
MVVQRPLFRCPRTGLLVQSSIAEAPEEPSSSEIYAGTYCHACRGWHLINRRTGKLLSDEGQGRD